MRWRDYLSAFFWTGGIGVFAASLAFGYWTNKKTHRDMDSVLNHYTAISQEQEQLLEEKELVRRNLEEKAKKQEAELLAVQNKKKLIDRLESYDSLIGVFYSLDDAIEAMEDHKPADELFDNFPLELPGAKRIRKHYAPGSAYCLVHIRQLHLAPVDIDTPELRNLITSVHKDIYQILCYLTERNNVCEVHSEGISEKNLEEAQRAYMVFMEHYEMLKKYEVHIGRVKELLGKNPDNEEIQAYLKKIQAEYELQAQTFGESPSLLENHAVFRLYREKKIKIKPSENDAISDDAFFLNRLFYEGKISRRTKERIVNEEREDAALEIISQDDSVMPVIVYGGGHDWTNNIRAWNSENPDKRFSLIVVTPESYKE